MPRQYPQQREIAALLKAHGGALCLHVIRQELGMSQGAAARTILAQDGSTFMQSEKIALSIADACALSSIGRTTLYAAIARGDLKVRRVGRRTLITAQDLRSWIDSCAAQDDRGSETTEANRGS